jgi:dTDP-4-amino-4,6-dideoxygalactose transaminase
LEDVENAVTLHTKVIICQNTFGLSSDIENITTFAKAQNIFTIEDCAHGFGGCYNQKPNGSYCDAAFFSTQWNKPFSTGTGGFALINNLKLLNALQRINQNLIDPACTQRISLKLLYFVKEKLLNKHTYWWMVKFYRFLSKHNLVLGSSSGEEISSVKMPKNYFMKLSQIQIKKGIKNIRSVAVSLSQRQRNAKAYTEYLAEKNKIHVPHDCFINHSFLRYPLLVKNREKVFRLAEKYKIHLGDWFNSPLHPVQKNFEKWQMDTANYPHAVSSGKQIINLPTDVCDLLFVLKFLEKIDDMIM